MCLLPCRRESRDEIFVTDCLQRYAKGAAQNVPDLCHLEPKAFVEQVINGGLAIDGGDWVQPLFRQLDGIWHLHKFEVLYRMSDARSVPFPAYVNFVKAASDQSLAPDLDLREAFRAQAVSSLRRVDAQLSQLRATQRSAMADAGLLTSLNFTAKQLEAILSVPLENGKLLAAEETEYDSPPDNLSAVRHQVWERLGALCLDDVKSTLAEVAAYAEGPLDYKPPLTPGGAPFKPLPESYNHDFAFAHGFMSDFEQTRRSNPEATGNLKLDEEFCCYFIGVGHAPFARAAMAQWREEHPVTARAVRRAGLELIREALAVGMGVVLEVSFEDSDVQWLYAELPELDGILCKQGGQSGSAALPISLVGAELLSQV